MRRPIVLLAALLAAGCRDFSLPPIETVPSPSVTSVEGPAQTLGGYSRDRVVLRGTNLGSDLTATFAPEGLAADLVEADAEHVVFEVPDLGDAGARTLQVACERGDWSAEYAFEFKGPGQPRSGRVVEAVSLASPFVTLAPPFVPSGLVPTGAAGYDQALRDLEEIRSDVFFARSPSDFLVSVGLQANVFTVAAEFDRIVLASAVIALPLPSQGGWVPGAVVAAVDWDGMLHLRWGHFARAAPDFGWVFVSSPVEGDDRPLGELSLFSDYSLLLRDVEVETAFFDPAEGSSSLARLAVLVRQQREVVAGPASVFVLDFGFSGGNLAVTHKKSEARAAPGKLSAVLAGDELLVSGISPPVAASPQLLYRLRAGNLGLPRLEEVAVEGAASLDRALDYPGVSGQQVTLTANSVAASADGSRLAVSFTHRIDGSSLPRLALFSRSTATGQWVLERTQSGAAIYHSLSFGARAGEDALYGLEALSGRLVRLSLSDLRLEAGFSAGEGATPLTVGAAHDGRRLVVSTLEKGEVLQFETSSESFLVPIVRDLHFGSLQAFEDAQTGDVSIVAYNARKTASGGSLPLPGEIAVVSGEIPFHLGAEQEPGAVVRAGVAVQRDRSLLLMVGTQAGGAAGVRASRVSFLPEGEVRIVSERCTSPWLIDGFSGSSERVLALASAVGGASSEKRLFAVEFAAQIEGRGTFCDSLSTVAEAPLWRTSDLGKDCHGNLVSLPDGRTAIRWAHDSYGAQALSETSQLCSQLTLVDASGTASSLQLDQPQDSAVPRPRERPLPWGRAPLAADVRGCAPSFKPALFTAVVGGIAALPVYQLDASGDCAGPWSPPADAGAASCRGGQPEGAQLFCANFGDLIALAASPNGRRLYAVADRAGSRWLIELDVDRDAAGSVRGLRSVSETLLGEAALFAAQQPPEPAGLAFSGAGASLHLTLSSHAEVLTYE